MFVKYKDFPRYFKTLFFNSVLFSTLVMAYEKDKTYHLTILHTNDHHGTAWANDKGQAGLAARMTLIESIRKEVFDNGGEMLLLDAGDINTGVANSDELFAKPDIKGMNLIGYDAMAIGDHEFDNPLPVLKQQESWAKFPFLSANIYEKGTENRLFKPYVILNKAGVKIAVIGLSTEDITRLSHIEHTDNLDVRSPVDETLKVIEVLHHSDRPDITIGLTHLGYEKSVQHMIKTPGDVALANTLPTGTFDLIIGGHSHDTICIQPTNKEIDYYEAPKHCLPDYQNGTWIMQAGESGEYVGRADFEFLNGEVKLISYQLIPVNLIFEDIGPNDGIIRRLVGEPIAPAKHMLNLLAADYQSAQDKIINETVGVVDKRLRSDYVKQDGAYVFKKTNLFELLMVAMIEKTDADLAVLGIQSISESIPAGKVSYFQILRSLHPSPKGSEIFFNIHDAQSRVVYVDLTGKELNDYLHKIYTLAYLTHVTFDINNDATLSHIKINNIPIDENKTYRLATLALYDEGLYGFPRINNHPNFIQTNLLSSKVLKDYIKVHTPLKAANYEP